ncbi:hypothetical protein [Microbacterium oleivorans]|nr:hypothetical protein [Microbacterium oleivorans]
MEHQPRDDAAGLIAVPQRNVFFRQSGTDLCVVDVTWATLLG